MRLYKAIVTITYKKSILDPRHRVKALKSLGYHDVADVRVGKHLRC